ncbi:hypothetical protein, conserved [Angomonas deanei]|uniref:Uncharacterized protein n=1 Tax=Angomonas deanei TaxID=59799 RepID=A0A7G2CF73_9TRYP|nr:hypothetical protein, conserved [Angomonas deanei]
MRENAKDTISAAEEDYSLVGPDGSVPLFVFVKSLPLHTLNDIFSSYRSVVHYISKTKLLRIVTVSDQRKDQPISYGSLLFVSLREEVLPFVFSLVESGESAEADPSSTGGSKDMGFMDVVEMTKRALQEELENLQKRGISQQFFPLAQAFHLIKKELKERATSVDMHYNAFSNIFMLHAKPLENPENTTLRLEDADHVNKFSVADTFWIYRFSKTIYIALKQPNATRPPPFNETRLTTFSDRSTPCSENNYGGWGSSIAVPTKKDVYEILKYVPIEWSHFGSLKIPQDIKKKHMRTSSPLQWFRRQPYYFELRRINNNVEIRRSILLHPEVHELTSVQAREMIDLKIASGEANSLVNLDKNEHRPADNVSPEMKKIIKFFLRVCPSYFVPFSLILQRYTKKNLDEEKLLKLSESMKEDFELYFPRHSSVPLVRQRKGADSSRWADAFIKDMESHPDDVQYIVEIFNVLICSWDRPDFILERLPPAVKTSIGGLEGLMAVLRRHPNIFRVGEKYVCRVDASNPLSLEEAEPTVGTITTRTLLRNENPYLSPLEVAKVFYALVPVGEPCTITYLVEEASPAMQVALPPRVISLIQQFPQFFACSEDSPGVFSIYKVGKKKGTSPSSTPKEAPVLPSNPDAPEAEDDRYLDEVDDSWREGTDTGKGRFSREEVVSHVAALIPQDGVDISQLLLWLSLPVQQSANAHFGGIVKMLEAEKNVFRITESSGTKRVFRA